MAGMAMAVPLFPLLHATNLLKIPSHEHDAVNFTQKSSVDLNNVVIGCTSLKLQLCNTIILLLWIPCSNILHHNKRVWVQKLSRFGTIAHSAGKEKNRAIIKTERQEQIKLATENLRTIAKTIIPAVIPKATPLRQHHWGKHLSGLWWDWPSWEDHWSTRR